MKSTAENYKFGCAFLQKYNRMRIANIRLTMPERHRKSYKLGILHNSRNPLQ